MDERIQGLICLQKAVNFTVTEIHGALNLLWADQPLVASPESSPLFPPSAEVLSEEAVYQTAALVIHEMLHSGGKQVGYIVGIIRLFILHAL